MIILHNLLFYGLFGLGGLVFSLLIYPLIRIFPSLGPGAFWIVQSFYRLILGSLRLSRAMVIAEVEGLEGVDLSRPTIFACNHRSLLDVLILFTLLPRASCLVRSMASPTPWYWRIFIGGVLQAMGYIPMGRQGEGALLAYEECKLTLRAGRSLIVFPEGTRSRDGRLGPFFDFPFKLAGDAQVPLVPVVIYNQPPILAKGQGLIDVKERAEFRLSFLPPLTPGKARDLSAEAHRRMRRALRAYGERHGGYLFPLKAGSG